MKHVPIFAVIMLAMPVMALQAITNGDFETGSLDPWTFNSGWSISTSNPHGGTYCALGEGNYYLHQDFTPFPVGDINSLSVWLRQPEVFHFKCRFYYGAEDFDQTVNITVPDDAWNQYDLMSYLRDTGDLEGMRVYSYNGGGGTDPDYTYLDDVSINHGSSAVESASLGELKAVFR